MSEPHHSRAESRIVSLTTEELLLLTSVAEGAVPKAGAFAISITRDRKYVVQRQPNGSNHSLGRVEDALASAQRELQRRQTVLPPRNPDGIRRPVLRVVAATVAVAMVALTVALAYYTQTPVASSVAGAGESAQLRPDVNLSAPAAANGNAVAVGLTTPRATPTFNPKEVARRIIGKEWAKGGTPRQRFFARSAVLRLIKDPQLARAFLAVINDSVEIEQFGDSEVWGFGVADPQVVDRAFQGPAGPMPRQGTGEVEWVRGSDFVVWRCR